MAPEVAAAFAQIAAELHQAPGVEDTVDLALRFAVTSLGCDHAGLALVVRGGRVEIGATTDPLVERLYRRQITTGRGPLLDALAEHRATLVSDVSAETRWPAWQRYAAASDLRSVLHVPMQVSDQTVGVLSLYSLRPNALDAQDETLAHVLAQHVAIAVATARREAAMERAMDSRAFVGQAVGLLMERYDLTSAQAFAVLRRYSQDTNTKLRTVAQHLVNTRRLPPLEPS